MHYTILFLPLLTIGLIGAITGNEFMWGFLVANVIWGFAACAGIKTNDPLF